MKKAAAPSQHRSTWSQRAGDLLFWSHIAHYAIKAPPLPADEMTASFLRGFQQIIQAPFFVPPLSGAI